jgi:uncharacterized protein (UPF0261 family)
MVLKKTVLCIGTLDSKGGELKYIKELIEKRGYATLVMDISGSGPAPFTPDITAEEVARVAGSTISEVRAFKEVGKVASVMTVGATRLAKDLYNSGKFQGIISVGGGTGSAIASAVMRELPIDIPKFMLSSQKIVQAGIRDYVGNKDIAVMPSVADISGINRLTRPALSKAAGAIVGMIEAAETEMVYKPLVFMTMLGGSSGCGLKVKSLLEDKGFEVVVFHTIGVGGETFEELVKSYPVKGVIELGLNEIGNELFGGLASAGPKRLEAAGKKGIPQIIAPGGVDFINFLGPETVPKRYKNRTLYYHNPQSTVPRLNSEELKLIGETIAKKVNIAKAPVKILIPTRGFSAWDREGNIFYDPEADKAFINSLEKSVNDSVIVKEIDAHINDDEFARAIVNELIDIVKV